MCVFVCVSQKSFQVHLKRQNFNLSMAIQLGKVAKRMKTHDDNDDDFGDDSDEWQWWWMITITKEIVSTSCPLPDDNGNNNNNDDDDNDDFHRLPNTGRVQSIDTTGRHISASALASPE